MLFLKWEKPAGSVFLFFKFSNVKLFNEGLFARVIFNIIVIYNI